jgi:Ca2+-binding RTX toxin-like protein
MSTNLEIESAEFKKEIEKNELYLDISKLVSHDGKPADKDNLAESFTSDGITTRYETFFAKDGNPVNFYTSESATGTLNHYQFFDYDGNSWSLYQSVDKKGNVFNSYGRFSSKSNSIRDEFFAADGHTHAYHEFFADDGHTQNYHEFFADCGHSHSYHEFFGCKEQVKKAKEEQAIKYFGPSGGGGLFSPSEGSNNARESAEESFGDAEEFRVDPLILDLDGNGVTTTNLTDGVYFDHDGNGFAAKTAWVGSGDGILVFDRNNDTSISDGSELFGNYTLLSNGQYAVNGFEALKEFDVNNDGVIDENDEIYHQLRVWVDKNGDGVTDQGELLTLKDAGVASINTGYVNSNFVDSNGNAHRQQGSFTKTDGTTADIHDVWFDVHLSDTVSNEQIEIDDEIKKLPNLLGFGNVHNLQAALMLDKSGQLRSALDNILTKAKAGVSSDNLTQDINEFIFLWAGADKYAADSRGKAIDARILYSLESFMGRGFTQGTSKNPDSNASRLLEKSFQSIYDYVFTQLVTLPRLQDAVSYVWDQQYQTYRLDTAPLIAHFKKEYDANAVSFLKEYQAFTQQYGHDKHKMAELAQSGDELDTLFGQMMNVINQIPATDFIKHIDQNGSVLTLNTNSGNVIFLGSLANDTITGRGTFNGGTGNDVLNATVVNSDDTFLFNLGDGQDVINNNGGKDRIIFGKDVTPEMISYRREGNHLVVVVGDQGDQMTLNHYFAHANYQTANRFEFADGTVWEDIRQRVFTQYYSDDKDTIVGTGWDDNIYAGDGDDSITDNAGNNYLDGGAGNDTITGRGTFNGGTGNDVLNATVVNSDDTFLFNLGDGQDVINNNGGKDRIIFGKDVTPEMISYRREGNHLVVVVGDQGDQMTLNHYFAHANYQTVNRFEFAGGTIWEDIRQRVFTQYYTDGKDTIVGTGWDDNIYAGAGDDSITDNAGNNYLDGGAGNDTITGRGTFNGGTGNDVLNATVVNSDDTFLFNLGDGQDVINNNGGKDRIIFGKDVTPEMISYRREGNHLVVVVGDQGDQMTLNHYFAHANYQTVNRFEFAGGTIWEDIRQRVFTQYYTDGKDTIVGTGWDDNIYAGAGDDSITDNAGNNYLDGGAGNDTITGRGTFNGGTGNDVLNATVGNSDDTFLFNLGDGQDVINNNGGKDRIIFGKDVTPEMISYRREGNHLVVVVGDQGDQMTLNHYFAHANYQTANRFEFADGTVWEDIRQRTFTQYYTDGKDTIVGTGWNDNIYAGAGDDTITDNAGNNYLDGGAGNDTITGRGTFNGGTGNDVLYATVVNSDDTFLFNLGDGQDVINNNGGKDRIIFGKDVTPEMISYRREGNHLVVVVGDQGDQMTLNHYFAHANYQTVNRFEFADGTVWEDIRQRTFTQYYTDGKDTIVGTGWNDNIYAGDGDDTITDNAGNNYLDGGAGNDTITGRGTFNGGTGNDVLNATVGNSDDTFLFNLGDGQDVINNNGGKDRIIFGKDVTPEMISYRREGNHLVVVVGDQGDQMTLNHYFAHANYQTVNRFEFADGTVWEDIRQRTFTQYYTDGKDTIVGTGWNDNIYAGDGDDTITDNAGNNYLDGGAGNDTITGRGTFNGGTGNDVLNATVGNSDDTFLFNLGDGQDVINNNGGKDRIIFGKDVTPEMISYRREGNHLVVVVGDQGDQMTLNHYFAHANYQTVNRFEFANGKFWDDIRTTNEFIADTTGNPRESTIVSSRMSAVTPPESTAIVGQANSLIAAMATFAPETGSSSLLPDNNAQTQNNLIYAANVA